MANPEEFIQSLMQAADIIDGLMVSADASPEGRRIASEFVLEQELRALRNSHCASDAYWDQVTGSWVS